MFSTTHHPSPFSSLHFLTQIRDLWPVCPWLARERTEEAVWGWHGAYCWHPAPVPLPQLLVTLTEMERKEGFVLGASDGQERSSGDGVCLFLWAELDCLNIWNGKTVFVVDWARGEARGSWRGYKHWGSGPHSTAWTPETNWPRLESKMFSLTAQGAAPPATQGWAE